MIMILSHTSFQTSRVTCAFKKKSSTKPFTLPRESLDHILISDVFQDIYVVGAIPLQSCMKYAL